MEDHGCGRGLQGLGCSGGTPTSPLLSGCHSAPGPQAGQANQRHLGVGRSGGCGGGSQGRAPLPDRRRGAHPRLSRQRSAPGGAQPRLARPGVDAADELLGGLSCHRARLRRPPVDGTGCSGSKGEQLQRSSRRPTGQPQPPSPGLQLRSRHARRTAHRPVPATASRVALGRSGARGEAWPPP